MNVETLFKYALRLALAALVAYTLYSFWTIAIVWAVCAAISAITMGVTVFQASDGIADSTAKLLGAWYARARAKVTSTIAA